MPHSEGQRVQYRNAENERCVGKIESVQGSGPNARYTVQNEDNQKREQIPENRIDRDL